MSRSKKQVDVWTQVDEWSWNKIVRGLQSQYEHEIYTEVITITTVGEYKQRAIEEHKKQEGRRDRIVSEDDVIDVKIQLGLCEDVSEFVNELD
jgi:hypothetical protein